VTGRLGLFPVKEAVETQGFPSEGRAIEDEGDELDSAGHESLDIEDVETLVEPVDQEIDGVDTVGSDGACLPLLNRGWIHGQGKDSQPDLGECFLEGGTPAGNPPAAIRVEVGEARAQDPPPPRSP